MEHRTRAEKDLDDEAFLCAAADIGAKTHAPVAALVPEMVRPDDAGGASETWTDKKTRKATAAATEDGPRPVGRGRVKVKRKTAGDGGGDGGRAVAEGDPTESGAQGARRVHRREQSRARGASPERHRIQTMNHQRDA